MAKRPAKTIPLPVSPADMTVEEAADAFLSRDLSPNTYANFRSDLRRFCRAFPKRPVSSISPEEVRDYLEGLTNHKGEPASPETCNRHLGTLRIED